MNLDQFIEFLIEEGEINREVIKKSLEVNEFALTHKILLKIEGQTTLLENILRPKNEGELVLAKGELLRICILNDKNVKQEGIKFIDELIKKVREKFNLYPSEKKVIKNKNTNKPTSKGNETFQESEEDLSSLIQKGDEFFNLEDFSKAIDFYNKAINLDDDDYETFYYRGISKYFLDQNSEAIKDLDKAIKLNPEDSRIWDFRGRSKYFLGQYEEAIKDLDKAIKLNPDDFCIWEFRGKSNYHLDQNNEAIKDLDEAINLDPENSDPWYLRGLCYYKLDENEVAIDDFETAIDLDPNDGRYFYYRSKAKLDSTKIYKINEIIDDLNKAVSLLDDSYFKEQVIFDRALLFKEKGEYEQCLVDLSYLIKQSSEIKYLKERILIYLDLYKYEKAIKDILKCCELDPENSLIYKGYLINVRSPNPYTGYKLGEELELEEIKRRIETPGIGNSYTWCLEEVRRINERKGKTFVGLDWDNVEVLNYLEEYFVDPDYRDRIITLFGVDGLEEFRKAVKLLPWKLPN